MSKAIKITIKCPKCGKPAQIKHEYTIGTTKFINFKCSHTVSEQQHKTLSEANRDPVWKKLFPYQQEAIGFIEESGFNCLIADPMGAGKTIEALGAIRYNFKELTPIVLIVKSALKYQWTKEIIKWLGETCSVCNGTGLVSAGNLLEYGNLHETRELCPHCTEGIKENTTLNTIPWIITGGNQFIPPGFKIYIFSMDIIKKYVDEIIALNPQLLIVDESQHFKELKTTRTRALFKIVKKTEAKLALITGTPILNCAPEYFTSLNLIRPLEWPNKAAFERDWCEWSWQSKKYTRIKPYLRKEFLEKTKNYILRRPKDVIMGDLPPFTRQLTVLNIEDANFIRAYEKERRNLEDFLDSALASMPGLEKYSHILAILARLRQIAGLAKVDSCVEKVEEYLAEENGNNKITIGIHHTVVTALLEAKLQKFSPILLNGSMTPEKKLAAETKFRENPNCKVMIASVLAAGEGLNLQFCNYAILLERQWNTPKEVQFEGRFHRRGTTKPVTVEYLVAKGSIDEWITELVEKKRHWINSALESGTQYGNENTDEDFSFNYMELANMCAQGKLK